jgi:TonB dependent receptor
LTDGVNWNKGAHFLRAGGEYRWVRSRYHIWGNARPSFTFNGAFTGNSVADFLLGDPNTAALSSVLIGDIRYKYYGGYVNDDWKITPKLTLNFGLRYEYWTPAYERNNLQANFVVGPNKLMYVSNNVPPSTPASLAMDVPSDVDNRGLVEAHHDNWAPRAGLAYQLFRNTVIRAGAGAFYAEANAAGISSRPEYNPPFRLGYSYTSDNIHPTLTFATGFPSNAVDPTQLVASATTLNAWDPAMAVGLAYHWSFSLQQQVGKLLVDANYVGTKGTHLSVPHNIKRGLCGRHFDGSQAPLPGILGYQLRRLHGQFRIRRALIACPAPVLQRDIVAGLLHLEQSDRFGQRLVNRGPRHPQPRQCRLGARGIVVQRAAAAGG